MRFIFIILLKGFNLFNIHFVNFLIVNSIMNIHYAELTALHYVVLLYIKQLFFNQLIIFVEKLRPKYGMIDI